MNKFSFYILILFIASTSSLNGAFFDNLKKTMEMVSGSNPPSKPGFENNIYLCDAGNAYYCGLVGDAYSKSNDSKVNPKVVKSSYGSNSVEKDIAKADEYYTKACRLGNIRCEDTIEFKNRQKEVEERVGNSSMNPTLKKNISLCLNPNQLQRENFCYAAGEMYYKGISGVEKDWDKAIEYYKMSDVGKYRIEEIKNELKHKSAAKEKQDQEYEYAYKNNLIMPTFSSLSEKDEWINQQHAELEKTERELAQKLSKIGLKQAVTFEDTKEMIDFKYKNAQHLLNELSNEWDDFKQEYSIFISRKILTNYDSKLSQNGFGCEDSVNLFLDGRKNNFSSYPIKLPDVEPSAMILYTYGDEKYHEPSFGKRYPNTVFVTDDQRGGCDFKDINHYKHYLERSYAKFDNAKSAYLNEIKEQQRNQEKEAKEQKEYEQRLKDEEKHQAYQRKQENTIQQTKLKSKYSN